MKIVKEAYTETVKVVFDPEYVTIQQVNGEPVHMSIKEAKEVVEWLSHELNRVLPEIIPMVMVDNAYVLEPKTPPKWPTPPSEAVYEPGARSATQTVEVRVGDPNLAYRHTGGRSTVAGDGEAGVMDLGALAAKVGRV